MFAGELDKWIDSYCKVFPFSGSVCVKQNGEEIYRRNIGMANCEWNILIDNDTRFRFYSLTKPFTALGLLRLYEQGKISLDVHPGKYITEAVRLHPAITIRDLLMHSHGLPDFVKIPDFSILQKKYPIEGKELLGEIEHLSMDFFPGTSVNYTNVGFYIVSLIIEAVSGMKFEDYMERVVFEELGMEHTVIDSAYRLIEKRASGYDINGVQIIAAPYQTVDWMKGAGAAVGTIDDVWKLHEAAKDALFVKPETWNMIFTPNTGGFGMGCSVSKWHDKIRYTHNGGHLGFRTLHIQLPEDDLGIVLLSNMGFGNARHAFSEAIYRLYYGETKNVESLLELDKGFAINGEIDYPILYPQRPKAYLGDLSSYIGIYKNNCSSMRVENEMIDGIAGLRVIHSDNKKISMYPIAEGKFFDRTIDTRYEFSKTKDGRMFLGDMIKEA